MSEDGEDESIFENIFGKGGAFEAIFGQGGGLDQALKSGRVIIAGGDSVKKANERARYQESLITELLITLAGKGLITNAEAQDVIRRAKERAKPKNAEHDAEAAEKPADRKEKAGAHHPCGGTCPLHDTRPHRELACQRCKKTTPHLLEGEVARCRVCLTPRMAS